MKSKVIIFLVFLLMASLLFADKVDSLKNILPDLNHNEKVVAINQLISLLPDKEKPHYFNLLTEMWMKSDPVKAEYYNKKAIEILGSYPDKKELASAYTGTAWLYFSPKLMYDSCEYFALKAIDLIKDDTFYNVLGFAYNIAGISQADQGRLEKGLVYFEKSEVAYLKAKNYCRAATIHHNIGKLNKYSKGLSEVKKFFLETLEMYKKNNCEENYDFLYSNLGEIYVKENNFEKAKMMFDKVLEIAHKYDKRESIGIAYFSLAELYMSTDTAKARNYYEKALNIANELEIVKLQIASNLDLGKYFLNLNKLEIAKKYLDYALSKSKEKHKLYYIQKAYEYMSEYYEKRGEYKKALQNYKIQMIYKDSLGAEKVRFQIMSLENDKKENQIKLLNKENEIIELKARRSRIFAYLISLILVLGLVAVVFLFWNYKNKQEMKKMEIERKTQNKILAMERRLLDSVIETEDRERRRFAADLHDGIGPLLSSVKLFLEGVIYSEESEKEELINETKNIVDQAIDDIRSISRNILPESFSKLGLVHTLLLFIKRIKVSKTINISFEHNLDGIDFNKAYEIIIYRILTELINNTLKHANAQNVKIRLIGENNKIKIYYEDDGKGFDVDGVINNGKSGIGLKNIKERVDSLGGEIHIFSEEGKGVVVEIILEIKYKSVINK